jgi:hypothetical protein
MKNTGKLVAIAFAVMVFVAAANAQSLVATVPFDFQVNDQQLEAGKYIVDVDASNKVVLRPATGGGTIILTSSAGPNNGSRPESCLVFRPYAGSMHLTEVWSANTDDGRSIRLDRKEAQLAKKSAAETIITAAFK